MKKIILSLALLGSIYSFGQLDRSVRPTAGEAPIINIAEPETFELSNGIKVIVSENHKLPKVTFNLVMGGDPILEGEKAGVSAVMQELLLTGTENRTKEQIDFEKDFIGAYLSTSSSNVYLSCLTKHMDKGLDLMLDVTTNSNFPASEYDRVKTLFESAILSTKTSPDEMAGNAERKALFPEENPYGEIMTEESLKNITREDVVNFYKQSFTPQGAYLVVVGDINLEDAKKIAEERFGKWKGVAPNKAEFNKGFVPQGNRVIFVEKPGAVQSVITIAHPIDMKPGNPDQIKLKVLNKILGGGGFGTRLMQNLREDKAYTYGAYSSLDIDRYGSYISASGNFRNDVTDSAIVQFLKEFNAITEAEVTDEELNLNKMAMQGGFARSLESPQTIASFALNIYRNNLPADYYQTYLTKLKAVTKADVFEVAKKYISPNNLNIIVVGNADVVEKLKQFDADGKIEIMDAFGNPTSLISYEELAISKEEVVSNYIQKITKTESKEAAMEKLKTLNSLEIQAELTIANAPVVIKSEEYRQADNKMMQKMEMNGMVMQKEVFNGTAGKTSGMGQAGPVSEDYTEEKVALENKNFNVLPVYEINLLNGNTEYELLGGLKEDGVNYIVIKYTLEKTDHFVYFNAESFLVEKKVSFTPAEDGSLSEMTVSYADYREVDGIMFSFKNTMAVGPQVITETTKEVVINGKIDPSVFEL